MKNFSRLLFCIFTLKQMKPCNSQIFNILKPSNYCYALLEQWSGKIKKKKKFIEIFFTVDFLRTIFLAWRRLLIITCSKWYVLRNIPPEEIIVYQLWKKKKDRTAICCTLNENFNANFVPVKLNLHVENSHSVYTHILDLEWRSSIDIIPIYNFSSKFVISVRFFWYSFHHFIISILVNIYVFSVQSKFLACFYTFKYINI